MKAKIYVGAKKYALYIGRKIVQKTLEFLALPARFVSKKVQELKNLTIWGQSIQNGTPTPTAPIEVESVGDKTKNLFDKNKQISVSNYGVTITVNEDGSYTLNGTSTNSFVLAVVANIPLKDNATYTIRITGDADDSVWFQTKGNTGDINLGNIYCNGTKDTTTFTNDVSNQTLRGNIRGPVGKTFNNTKVYINLVEGEYNQTTMPKWEPYGYKVPVVVGSQGIVDLGTLSWTKRTNSNGIVYYRTNGGLPNVFIDNLNNKYYLKDYTFKRFSYSDANTYDKTISTPSDGINFTVVPDKEYSNEQDFVNYISGKFLYYQRDIDSEYIAPTTTNLYLNEPLRKIGEYADYIDFESQKVIRNIKEEIIDNTESWSYTSSAGTWRADNYFQNNNNIQGAPVLCNKYPVEHYNSVSQVVDMIVGVPTLTSSTTNMYRIYFKDTMNAPTTTTAFKQWLAENEITIIYPLATPIEESITLPPINITQGTLTIDVETKIKPSKINITGDIDNE